MNILKKLLFSFDGKIGRADFIYGIVYGYLLALVSLDALMQPFSWELIGYGIDLGFVAQYIASVFGIIYAVWILGAIISKRSRALGYNAGVGFLLGFLFPPFLLIGLKKDTEVFLYNGQTSFTDRAFFYVVIAMLLFGAWSFYEINIGYKYFLTFMSILAIVCIVMFSNDRDPLHTYPRQKYIGLDSFLDILFVISIVFFIRLYLISPFQIIGPSMENTFHGGNVQKDVNGQYGDGEFILVDKMTYKLTTPKRGDVVVFSPRIGPSKKYLIKRVMGLPGDTIKIADKFVFIATAEKPNTFIKIDESSYLGANFGNTCLDIDCYSDPVTFHVPEGHYFLMGDNRPFSLDSRQCFGECDLGDDIRYIPTSSISGRVVYSLGHFDMFKSILTWPPVLGTMKQVIPWRGTGILNEHVYPELK